MAQSSNRRRTRRRSQSSPGTIRSHLRAAAGTAMTGLGERISGQINSRRQSTQQRNGQGQSERQGKPWTLKQSRRPQLVFDKGDLAQFSHSLPKIWDDSQGAAIAICRYIALHQQPHTNGRTDYGQFQARNSYTKFQRMIHPDDESLRSAKEGIREAQYSSDPRDLPTAQTIYLEEQYLRFMKRLPTEMRLRQLLQELLNNANDLRGLAREARQAYPRIMAADIYLQLGDSTNANAQMVQAFAIIGIAFPNEAMYELAQNADSELAQQAISSHDSGTTHEVGLASDQIRS